MNQRIVPSITLTVVQLVLAHQLASAQLISPEVRVSAISAFDFEPAIVAYGSYAVAVWSRSVESSPIGSAYSTDNGQTWTDGGFLQPPSGIERVDSMVSLSVDGNGRFYAIAVVCDLEAYPENGNTVALWRGDFLTGSFTWEPGIPTLPKCQPAHIVNGELFQSDPCFDMPNFTCDPITGNLYLSVTLAESYAYDDYRNTVQFSRSIDGGQTWSPLQTLSSPTSNGSRVSVGPGGEVFVVWVDLETSEILGRKSMDSGVLFEPTFTIAPFSNNIASGPPEYRMRSGRQNPVYAYCGYFGMSQDFPSIAIDRSGGVRNGTIYAAWAEKVTGPLDPDTQSVNEAEPNDWFNNADPVALGETVFGSILGEHPTLPPDRDVFYFDGVAGTKLWLRGEMRWTYEDYDFPICSGFNIYCEDDSVYILARGVMPEESRGLMPPVIVTLPKTGRYYVLVHTQSYSYDYVLRLRTLSPDPQSVARDHRDIVLTSSKDGGQTWSPKVRVNDDPPLFDDAFPEVVVDNMGTVHVVWYGHRDDPRGLFANAYWSQSLDGIVFQPSRRLSSQSSSWRFTAGSNGNIGDHLGLTTFGDRVYALWTQQGRPDVDIYGVTITPEPVAIDVTGFHAELNEGIIRLEWQINDPSEAVLFRVHREEKEMRRKMLGEVQANGSREYFFEDRAYQPGAIYQYSLEIVGRSGQSEWTGPVSIDSPRGSELLWTGGCPNPFSSSIRLTLSTPMADQFIVRVYDVAGRETRNLFDGASPAGVSEIRWDGIDQEGHQAPAGVYLVHARQGEKTATARILKLR